MLWHVSFIGLHAEKVWADTAATVDSTAVARRIDRILSLANECYSFQQQQEGVEGLVKSKGSG